MARKDGVKAVLDTMRAELEKEDTYFSDECIEELIDLIDNKKAAESFSDALTKILPYFRENPTIYFNKRDIFEIPTLPDDAKIKKKGESPICCYKDKKKGNNNNNIRCIFIMEGNIISFILAFQEKAKIDYRQPLRISVDRYNDMLEGD